MTRQGALDPLCICPAALPGWTLLNSFFLTHRVVLPHVRLVEHARVPHDPADVVHGQSHEQVLVHLDAAAVQAPGRGRGRKREEWVFSA